MARVMSPVDLLLVPSLRDEMLTISNNTGHPSLTLRTGFVKVSRGAQRLGARSGASAAEVLTAAPRAARRDADRPAVRRGNDRARGDGARARNERHARATAGILGVKQRRTRRRRRSDVGHRACQLHSSVITMRMHIAAFVAFSLRRRLLEPAGLRRPTTRATRRHGLEAVRAARSADDRRTVPDAGDASGSTARTVTGFTGCNRMNGPVTYDTRIALRSARHDEDGVSRHEPRPRGEPASSTRSNAADRQQDHRRHAHPARRTPGISRGSSSRRRGELRGAGCERCDAGARGGTERTRSSCSPGSSSGRTCAPLLYHSTTDRRFRGSAGESLDPPHGRDPAAVSVVRIRVIPAFLARVRRDIRTVEASESASSSPRPRLVLSAASASICSSRRANATHARQRPRKWRGSRALQQASLAESANATLK